jgi:hypothetical protein
MKSDRAMFELKPIPLCHPAGVSTPGAPTGVVTFLFTDIEGSTRRWEADAAAMRNPWAISFALWAYGYAHGETDPDRARDAMRRGLTIAQVV